MYFYQTSAKGWYSDRAAHVKAVAGDAKHARRADGSDAKAE